MHRLALLGTRAILRLTSTGSAMKGTSDGSISRRSSWRQARSALRKCSMTHRFQMLRPIRQLIRSSFTTWVSDAVTAGGPPNVTPFNGEHNAGVQVLNTTNFPDLQGPLININ